MINANPDTWVSWKLRPGDFGLNQFLNPPLYAEKLVRWFDQESELLRSKGIDDADPRVVVDAVMRRHLAEIKSDPALVAAILTEAKNL
jgi:hypothetical protein